MRNPPGKIQLLCVAWLPFRVRKLCLQFSSGIEIFCERMYANYSSTLFKLSSNADYISWLSRVVTGPDDREISLWLCCSYLAEGLTVCWKLFSCCHSILSCLYSIIVLVVVYVLMENLDLLIQLSPVLCCPDGLINVLLWLTSYNFMNWVEINLLAVMLGFIDL